MTKTTPAYFALFLVLASGTSSAQTPTAKTDTVVATPKEENLVFEKAEVEASVNLAEWRRHLEKHLVPYIEKAAKKKMKVGTYTVMVRFLVEKDGSISDVRALNDPGYGLAEGAEKVIRTGPKWIAGQHKGKKVRSYHSQPIFFQIQEG